MRNIAPKIPQKVPQKPSIFCLDWLPYGSRYPFASVGSPLPHYRSGVPVYYPAVQILISLYHD